MAFATEPARLGCREPDTHPWHWGAGSVGSRRGAPPSQVLDERRRARSTPSGVGVVGVERDLAREARSVFCGERKNGIPVHEAHVGGRVGREVLGGGPATDAPSRRSRGPRKILAPFHLKGTIGPRRVPGPVDELMNWKDGWVEVTAEAGAAGPDVETKLHAGRRVLCVRGRYGARFAPDLHTIEPRDVVGGPLVRVRVGLAAQVQAEIVRQVVGARSLTRCKTHSPVCLLATRRRQPALVSVETAPESRSCVWW